MTLDADDRDPLRIFEMLLELEPIQRDAELDRICADDKQLRAEVLRLIDIDKQESDSDFLAPISGALIGIAEHAIPDRVGPFEIIEQIGEGGFGIVYLAQQSKPIERKVAIKVIKPGMDSRAVIRRFDLERRALAMMEHPHIASVIDGGIVAQGEIGAGRPWFAMEFVDGAPITKHAAEHDLALDDRLHLIIQACGAVQHAHSKAIIHRDLKPSNILVTQVEGEAFCKVIDFGVSKALESATPDGTLFTNPGAMVGTPQYMSPEQAMGSQDIDIRSDVYSMGMVLYELLTGFAPYDKEALESSDILAIRRMIELVDPMRPSSRVQRAIDEHQAHQVSPIIGITKGERQEIDWITMRAIDKDPERRYATIADLGQDLERFLRNEPVDAGPPSRSYRIRKFVRRNRVPVIFGGITTAAILIAAVGMLMFGLAAERARAQEAEQRQTAERQAERVRTINSFLLMDLFSSVDSGALGPDASLVEMLDEIEPLIDVRFQGDFDLLTLLHANFATMNSKLHRFERAHEHADAAVAMLDRATDLTNNQRSTVYLTRSSIHEVYGHLDEAEADIRESIRLIEDDPDASEGSFFIRQASLGNVLMAKSKLEKAEPLMRSAVEYFAENSADDNQQYQSIILSNYVGLLVRMKRYETAATRIEQLLEVAQQLDGRAKTSAEMQARFWQTNVMRSLGKVNEAADSAVQLVITARDHLGEDAPVFAAMLMNTGNLLAQADRFDEAIPILSDGIESIERIYGPYHYEMERYTNIIARLYRANGYDEEYLARRQKGLLLRFYVAGPGEQESVFGIMPEGEALLGSMDAWVDVVIAEAESLPAGHEKRARFLAHASIALQSIAREDHLERLLMEAHESLQDSERVDEVRRILLYAIPSYYESIDKLDEASFWRERLGDS